MANDAADSNDSPTADVAIADTTALDLAIESHRSGGIVERCANIVEARCVVARALLVEADAGRESFFAS